MQRRRDTSAKKIAESSFSIDINIARCPNKYIAGEETAMIEVIEGRTAKPWQKPPFYPAARGLHGKPTLVNNTETLSNIPHIILKRRGVVFKNWFFKEPGHYALYAYWRCKQAGEYMSCLLGQQ